METLFKDMYEIGSSIYKNTLSEYEIDDKAIVILFKNESKVVDYIRTKPNLRLIDIRFDTYKLAQKYKGYFKDYPSLEKYFKGRYRFIRELENKTK